MHLKKHTFTLVVTLFWVLFAVSQGREQKQVQLANSYYKKGEFQKALLIYKKLYDAKPYSHTYVYKLTDTYQQLEQYTNAQTILQARIQKKRKGENCQLL